MTADLSVFVNCIRESRWFAGLPDSAIYFLAEKASIKRFEPKQFIYQVGQNQNNICCILSGRVRVNVTGPDGKEFVLANLSDGTWLGEASLVAEPSRVLEVKVESLTEALVLPAHTVLSVAEQYPVIYKNLFEDQLRRGRLAYELMTGMLFYPLKTRIAGRLLWLAENQGRATDAGIMLDMKLSQTDFANMTMGSRQRVNKAFREWTELGIIKKHKGRYIVKDIDALRRVFASSESD